MCCIRQCSAMKSGIPKTHCQRASEDAVSDDLEKDKVWQVLQQMPRSRVSEGFSCRVLQAVRQSDQQIATRSWSTRMMHWSMAAASMMVLCLWSVTSSREKADSMKVAAQKVDELNSLEEVVAQEVLLAATDQLQHFSDTELVTLIGF